MKLKKKIAVMGAAVMMMASVSVMGASAYQESYQDSSCIILAYTSTTPDTASSNGTITNLSDTETKYSIQSTLYYKTSGNKTGSYTPSGWNSASLSKNQALKASTTHSRNTSYKYAAYTQVLKNNNIFKFIKSDY